ncbi:bifunctional hydroxyacyl-CoA dehydrogenase/enoyl-CoA hydratase [Starmerella bacillaris]|uniref:Bifunctional hydroxyacyl-CoA dehydrogenase/enoyl-CoA hydratase n=1 Tax=Starmerella bacillaris TaxID=1247836 RepID=A0AAV5RG80_STABA|nr:bifunctional hydroxyacyl-CoA dehydrogenase/enoyl-CoA hydratase [Starmerella bacillaris]
MTYDKTYKNLVNKNAHISWVPAPPSAEQVAKAKASVKPPSTTPVDFLGRFRLDGKVAVVTGAGRGLGYSMAEGLCSVGLKALAIIDFAPDIGQESADRLGKVYGCQTKFYEGDVRDEKAVTAIFDDVVKQFGHVDVVINSAGVADLYHAEDYPIDKFERVLDINVKGTFIVCQQAGKHMIERGAGGAIVNIASMSGHIVNFPQPQCAYNASKAAVYQLTRSLAVEWAPLGIRVNSISPGYMDTALNRAFENMFDEWNQRTPVGRLGNVDELTNAAIYLASPAASYTTGTDIIIDGAYTCV